jgi:3-oxoacyl-[acyl-carrier protein] reductase
MNDFLLQVSQNRKARQFIKTLGLPIPLPETLRRASGPGKERPLEDKTVLVCGGTSTPLTAAITETLHLAGAKSTLLGPDAPEEGARFDSIVFDASGLVSIASLRLLYDVFHAFVPRLGRCGRVLVLGQAAAGLAPEAAAAQAALEGFVRSVGKEIGKTGSTANVVYVESGAEARIAGVLRFLLSPRSAFVTGQPLYVRGTAAAGGHVRWVRPFDSKVALVTGAARGIGEATARALAAEGAHVICLDRPADDVATRKLALELRGSVHLCDVADPATPKVLCDELRSRFGGVDIVVHNAGITRDKTIGRMSPEQWEQVVDINLGAVVRITEALLDGVLLGNGRIVCLSSISGIAGNVGQTNYAASKGGLIGYVRSLAPTVASRGITVNAVAPGFIETRMTAAVPFAIREAGRRMSSLGQGGQPEDVAQVITFLASPGAIGLTGTVVRVCGGSLVGA